MRVAGTVEITGADELHRALKALGPEVEKLIVTQAIKKALTPIMDEAKAICPVDPDIDAGEPPGTLREDIHIFVYGKSKTSGRLGGMVECGNHPWGEKAFYAGFVEYGHGGPRKKGMSHKKGSRNNENATPAHPFMRPAFDAKGDQAVSVFEHEIRSGINVCVENAKAHH